MAISAAMVKELREMTGAGMMDCKNTLAETGGDMDKAVDLLREKGLGKAAKKADRLASEGLVSVEVSEDCTMATLSEINSETDFVAKNESFQALTQKTTAHIQSSGFSTVEELMESTIGGVNFKEYFNTQIATIGENLVVRRFATVKAGQNGVVNGYLHSNGKVGVIIAAACDSEKTAKAATEFIRSLCMHAAAMKPLYLSHESLDLEFVEKETIALIADIEKTNEEYVRLGKPLKKVPQYGSRLQLTDAIMAQAEENIKAELRAQNKPEKIWDKIVPGQLERFIADNTQLDQQFTLLNQFYVMDDKKTIAQVVAEKAAELGGKIELVEYVRFELGEGLEKKQEDFAAEVAAQIG
ncbi:elongation factor Ts [Sulfurospirillum sp. T05]|uniref:Elongation factor Ts n=1 Tax=Sulfurospirillum tamanense TaxID=2813362 RepID=A0ABS2WNB2_9BACT|nr:translation elongation factor Ts [Sulfurospirillum tamanensis]MBN2963151.1 elongation factor Ts [Sulfurospirillum tamanensis]